jgi:hypothetical protein
MAFKQVISRSLLTLYGQVRYPLCGRCRCRPMQPMGSRQLARKGLRCNGPGGLYGGAVRILYGPGIASDAFQLLCRKSSGLVTSIGPRMRTCVDHCPCQNMLRNHKASLIVLQLLSASLDFLAFSMQRYGYSAHYCLTCGGEQGLGRSWGTGSQQ